MASQVALSIVVLAAAGALARSLGHLASQGYGFDRERVLVVDIDPARAGYTFARLAPLYRTLRERLDAVPGVTRTALSYYSPFDACCWAFTISVQGRTPPADGHRSALLNRVSPGYFETLGTRVLNGRGFDDRDTPSAPRVAIVNHAFTRRFLGGGDPIGTRFSIGDGGAAGAIEIVGLVEDAKYDSPRDDADPMAFLPLLQTAADETDVGAIESQFIRTIEVRAAGNPALVAGAVRRSLAEIDADLPVLGVATLSSRVGQAMNREQAVARLAGFFAVVALMLTSVGVYGSTAYSVQRRTREIGIRVALGATRRAVVGMMIRDVMTRAAIGALLGIPAAFAVLRAIRSALYGVGPTDLRDASAAAVVLFASMAAAGYAPARRASRIEPVQALRHD